MKRIFGSINKFKNYLKLFHNYHFDCYANIRTIEKRELILMINVIMLFTNPPTKK